MKTQKKAASTTIDTAPTTSQEFTDNSAEAQRARLLAALHRGPMTTLEIRQRLDILMPAARVHELRHLCRKNIATMRVHRQTDSGVVHSVALYVLQPDPQSDLLVDDDPDYSPYVSVEPINSSASSALILA